MADAESGYGEFEWIAAVRARFEQGDDVTLGIGDDAALITPPPGESLAISIDTLAEDVHFPRDTPPVDLGYRSLAVNLSDLAAMGARPAWATLALCTPELNHDWCDAYLDGFADLARRHHVRLVGGDTTRGPLTVTVQVAGYLPEGRALTRSGARPGDAILVTGTLGDAALALRLWRDGRTPQPHLARRFHRPTPRIAAGRALLDVATAAIDLSDGLISDVQHLLEGGGVGARLSVDLLPSSVPLQSLTSTVDRWRLQLGGGDDYELCACVPAADVSRALALLAETDTPATIVGEITEGSELELCDSGGAPIEVDLSGYRHF